MEIKELRKKKKMTQKEFADCFNIPLRTIQKWEQHDSEPLPYLISLIQDEITEEEYFDVTKYMRKPQKIFNVVNKHRFRNNERIHPLQQQTIEEILKTLKDYKEVKRVIVFGSSTEERCNYESDIDLYVELSSEASIKKYNVEKPVDLWTNYTVSPEMYEEIKKKGVVVYAR